MTTKSISERAEEAADERFPDDLWGNKIWRDGAIWMRTHCALSDEQALRDKITLLESQLKEATEVIGFYADHGNWKSTNEKCQCDGFIVGSDLWHPLSHAAVCTRPYGGKRAREYLSKLKKEQG